MIEGDDDGIRPAARRAAERLAGPAYPVQVEIEAPLVGPRQEKQAGSTAVPQRLTGIPMAACPADDAWK